MKLKIEDSKPTVRKSKNVLIFPKDSYFTVFWKIKFLHVSKTIFSVCVLLMLEGHYEKKEETGGSINDLCWRKRMPRDKRG